MKRKHLAACLLLAGLIGGITATTASAHGGKKPPKEPKTTQVQILGLNDFHGQLEVVDPLLSSGGRIGPAISAGGIPAGGVEYLAAHVRELRKTNKNTLFVSAGDLIGATPLLSALFHDEPTIEAFNLMNLDYNGVGNHEFDEGVDELLRMQYGNRKGGGNGCHPVDGCGDGDGFRGAEFQFLAANVEYKQSGKTIFPGYAIENFKGVKVGIIGMTLEGTPSIVTPDGIANVNFLDEAETANAIARQMKRQGVKTIVVLLHEGGSVSTSGNGAGDVNVNQCQNPTGALPPIVEAMDDEIDVVITGHTNWAVNCIIDGKVVTGAASQGRLITDIDLTIDNKTGQVVQPILVNNRIVTQDVPKAPDLTALLAKYNAFAGPIAARVIGQTTAPILRANNAAGESALGDVIADAQLANTQAAGAQIALMNPGGIRADIGTAGDLTYGAAFAVQPFSNIVVTMTLTGDQLRRVLEEQFVQPDGVTPRTVVLQVSNGFSYTWSASAPIGSKVSNMMLNGVPIDLAAPYRVTVNSFLATGGDSFNVLNEGTDRVFGDDDLVALEEYFATASPVAPGPQDRITRVA